MTRALLGLATVLALAACIDSAAPERSVTFTGRWASQPWEGAASALLVPGGADGDTLLVFGRFPPDPSTTTTQLVRLRVAPFRGPGSYPLEPEHVEVIDLVGGDAMTSYYIGRSPVAGTLDIVNADGVGRDINGAVRFDAVFAQGTARYGQAAAFERGQFRAVLEQLAR